MYGGVTHCVGFEAAFCDIVSRNMHENGRIFVSTNINTQLFLGIPGPREHSALPILRRVQAGIAQVRLGRTQSLRICLGITALILHHPAWIR